ncbi:MAG: hypothetical protein ACI8X3_003551 [Saprospiraceae bacterium]|jgi:hypothetical protein
MRILKTWQSQFREHLLQKTLFKLDSQRHPVPFEAAQAVGVLFNATDKAQRDQIIPFIDKLKKAGKQVMSIGFFDNNQDPTPFAFKGFNKNDLDWLGRPKKAVLEKYTNKPFDLLICIYQGECIAIEYIAALSIAHFRVGPYTANTYCYDLIIDTAKNDSIPHFLKEVDFYLHKINKKDEPANI